MLKPSAIPSVFKCWSHLPHIYRPVKERSSIQKFGIPSTESHSDLASYDERPCDISCEQSLSSLTMNIDELVLEMQRLKKENEQLQKECSTVNVKIHELNQTKQRLIKISTHK